MHITIKYKCKYLYLDIYSTDEDRILITVLYAYEAFIMSITCNFKLNSESYISRLQLTNVYPAFMLCISLPKNSSG